MSPEESFYKKDTWLHSDVYRDVIAPNLVIFQELYKNHYAQIKDFALQKGVAKEDVHDFSLKALIVFTLKKKSGEYKDEGEVKAQNFAYAIAWNLLRKYQEKSQVQKKEIKTTDEVEDNQNVNTWHSDMQEEDFNALAARQLQFLEECKNEFLQSDKEHLKLNINMLFSKYALGLKNKDLAERINTTEGGIKRRNQATYNLLRECIEHKMKFKSYTRFL